MSDSDLVRRAAEGIRPSTAGWTYLSFRTLWRKPGEELTGQTGSEETALIWLGGTADVEGFCPVRERYDSFCDIAAPLTSKALALWESATTSSAANLRRCCSRQGRATASAPRRPCISPSSRHP